MIPYFNLDAIQIGPISIHPFGILASLAVISGVWYSHYTAKRELQAGETLLDMAPWFLFPGLLGSHIAVLLFYSSVPIQNFKFWMLFDVTSGMSSFGGLFTGTLAAYLYIRYHKLPVLPWFDVLTRGFTLAFVFGRLGCALAHDHPGTVTDFPLAMTYAIQKGLPPEVRHELGFYELLLFIPLFTVFHFLSRKKRKPGFYLGWFIVVYTPVRFLLDFLRINDPRYLGLTFGQWSCCALFPVGFWLIWKLVHGERPIVNDLQNAG